MIQLYSILAICILAPLVASWLSVDIYRAFSIEVGSALGIIGFSTILIAFLISGRTRWLSNLINIDQAMRAHRTVGIAALSGPEQLGVSLSISRACFIAERLKLIVVAVDKRAVS